MVHDRHSEGLFSRAEWLETLREAGFTPEQLVYEHSEGEDPLELFVGVKARA